MFQRRWVPWGYERHPRQSEAGLRTERQNRFVGTDTWRRFLITTTSVRSLATRGGKVKKVNYTGIENWEWDIRETVSADRESSELCEAPAQPALLRWIHYYLRSSNLLGRPTTTGFCQLIISASARIPVPFLTHTHTHAPPNLSLALSFHPETLISSS